MTPHPLDELLAACGEAPIVPPTPAAPSFSVIVRTQGRRPGSLIEAVESVLAQSYARFEVLVVVHGDAASYRAVRESLPERARTWPHRVLRTTGGGRARPLNVGLEAASGDYVCFLDDDDLARPGWLEAFASAAGRAPGTIVRAVAETQAWTTLGGEEPIHPAGEIERPYAPIFDLLAHMSGNATPICSVAVPRAGTERLGVRFDESLPVFEDWEFLMRLAMLVGVTSIPDATTLYRRLDHGNADTVHDPATWNSAHWAVINRLASRPVLLPASDARRVAGAHFIAGGQSLHERELIAARAEIDALTRSPKRWLVVFALRAFRATRHRIASAVRSRR